MISAVMTITHRDQRNKKKGEGKIFVMEPELRGSETHVILSRSVLCSSLIRNIVSGFCDLRDIMKETLSQLFYQFFGGGGDRERDGEWQD